MKDHRKRRGFWITVGLAIATIFSVSWAEAGTTYLTANGADDTTQVNNAINAAFSAGGGTVYLNAGTFKISGSINAKSGVILMGGSRDTTTVQYIGNSVSPMVELGGQSNVEMSGFTLDGNSASASQGINAWSGSNNYLHDLGIKNLVNTNGFGPAAIYFSGAMTNSKIVNNSISNIGATAQYGSGIRMENGSSGNQVLGNTIANTGRGGIFTAASTDTVIRNNTITGSGGVGLGIEVWGGSDRSLIENNVMDKWLSVDASSGVAVRNNTVNGGSHGLELATSGRDNVFSNNTVNGAQIGISVSGASAKERVLWTHNTIKASNMWGAQIQDDGGGVQKMYFYKNTFEGATGVGGVYPGQGDGVRFNPNGSIQNVTLDSNTIRDNARCGITCGNGNTDKLSVINNVITGNGAAAFSGSYGSETDFVGTDLRWEGNIVEGNGSNNQQTSEGTFFPSSVPSVSIIAPNLATVGQAVQFGLNYVEGADPLGSVLWDRGAGLPTTAQSPSFTYSDPGTYTVGLVVWDTLGRSAFSEFSLTVSVPEPSQLVLLLTGLIGLLAYVGQRWK